MQDPKSAAQRRGNTFFGGVLILTIANVLVKLFGFLYKVPLNRVLGDEMANVNAAYSVYTLLYMISTAGIPVAVSVLISKAKTEGRSVTLVRTLRVALVLLTVIGTLGTAGMLVLARPISDANSGGDSYLCLIAIAPALLFVCISSVLRGYFQGFGIMMPTALSGLCEAFGKMALGLLFVRLVLTSTVGDAHLAAGYSVLGITVGVALGTLCLVLALGYYRRRGILYCEARETVAVPVRTVAISLLRISLPIALSSGVAGIAAMIDTQLMRPLLTQYYGDADLAKAVFSDYTTGAVTLFNMPGVLVYPIASAIVPYITAARARGDREGAGVYVRTALRLAALISLPAALGLSVLSRPILTLVFVGDADMAENAGAPLAVLALAIAFLGLFAVTNAVLQAYGRQNRPILSITVGAVCKVLALYLLTPIVGPLAAPIGTLLFYLVAFLFNLYFLYRCVGGELSLQRVLLAPMPCAAGAASVAFLVYRGCVRLGNGGGVLLAILAAAAVYLVAVGCFRVVTVEDIAFLPHGDRLLGFLKRHRVIRSKNE